MIHVPSKGAQPNQSLIDGIETLQALVTAQGPVGGRELARRLGFEHTRVNRILKTLAYLGIARQTANRKYMPGPGVQVLAAQSLFASGFVSKALPVLESLRRFGHTVAMGVIWRDLVSYMFHGPPGVPTADAIGRIGIYPATKGGIGLALLSTYPDDAIQALYADRPIDGGFDNLDTLFAAIEQTRQAGYVRRLIKEDPDQHTVAVVVGEPAFSAIGVFGWIPEAETEAIVQELRSAADKIAPFTSPTDGGGASEYTARGTV